MWTTISTVAELSVMRAISTERTRPETSERMRVRSSAGSVGWQLEAVSAGWSVCLFGWEMGCWWATALGWVEIEAGPSVDRKQAGHLRTADGRPAHRGGSGCLGGGEGGEAGLLLEQLFEFLIALVAGVQRIPLVRCNLADLGFGAENWRG